MAEPPRTRAARAAAEQALVRVVHHYGGTPGFVVLGGLVPEMLCSGSGRRHAGTTDIDVQVDLEIAAGTVNTQRLERALANAEFVVSGEERIWRWEWGAYGQRTIVKFELLADRGDVPAQNIVRFDDCEALGAVNLRGTGFAAQDYAPQPLRARVGGVNYEVQVNVTGLAGFLLAKSAAAFGRRKQKDWYDIAFVLLYNDDGGPSAATEAVIKKFGGLPALSKTAVADLRANFTDESAQGPAAFASQLLIDHPDANPAEAKADAVLAVSSFCSDLLS